MGRLLATTKISYKNWHYPEATVIKPGENRIKVDGIECEIPLLEGVPVLKTGKVYWVAEDKPYYLGRYLITVVDTNSGMGKVYHLATGNARAGFPHPATAICPSIQGILWEGNNLYLLDFVGETAFKFSAPFEIAHAEVSCAYDKAVYAQCDNKNGNYALRLFLYWDAEQNSASAVKKEVPYGYISHRGHLLIDQGQIIWASSETLDLPPYDVYRPFENLRLTTEPDDPPPAYGKPFIVKSAEEFFAVGGSYSLMYETLGSDRALRIGRGEGWFKTNEGEMVLTPDGFLPVYEDFNESYVVLGTNGKAYSGITCSWKWWLHVYHRPIDLTSLSLLDDTGNRVAIALVEEFVGYRFAKLVGDHTLERPRRGIDPPETGELTDRPVLKWKEVNEFTGVPPMQVNLFSVPGVELVAEMDLSSCVLKGKYEK